MQNELAPKLAPGEAPRRVNMVEAIQVECNRVREIIRCYEDLPHGVGTFGAIAMRELIKRSEKAISEMDAVECVRCLRELREVET
jgi:hypothetical protein